MNKLVAELDLLRRVADVSMSEVCRKAGLRKETLSDWRREKYGPTLANFEAAVNALGFRLAILPLPIEKEGQP